ncbi:hypothetical protein E1B28_009064 [Marasmius oreades]|uniref:Mss4-like protein n=1 Tax=Marasmius oreades TaxID=181124 RepID=A0A9P7S0X7_9AGAR|nr:uncharacterized protein E1B28_009064 [Marasmius oreades]KAG7092736.1 hypothetical protein E1B28_009064 [Marasmius oreades]
MSSADQLPPGIWDALERSSTRTRPTLRLLTTFKNGIADVSDEVEGEDIATKTNRYDLLCPRDGCASIILKKGVGKLIQRENSPQIDPSDLPVNALLPSISHHTSSNWWLITPSPMQFENIGFSRIAESLPVSPSGKKIKLIACAECDLGPLGWSEEGGTEFWLASTRVGYCNEQ